MKNSANNTRPSHTAAPSPTPSFNPTAQYLVRQDRIKMILSNGRIPADLIASIRKVGTGTPVLGWQAQVWASRLAPFFGADVRFFETPNGRARRQAEHAARIAATRTCAIGVWATAPRSHTAGGHLATTPGSERAKVANASLAARYMVA